MAFRHAPSLDTLALIRAEAETETAGGRALALADPGGLHHIAILAADGTEAAAILLPLDASFRIRAEAAMRFHRLVAGRPTGPPPRALALTPRHRQRLVRMVRALDGRASGASYREIASVLFGAQRQRAAEWKASSIRAQTIRLVSDGGALMRGGYLKLLGGR